MDRRGRRGRNHGDARHLLLQELQNHVGLARDVVVRAADDHLVLRPRRRTLETVLQRRVLAGLRLGHHQAEDVQPPPQATVNVAADERALAADPLDEPLAVEFAERLADGASGDVQAAGQFDFSRQRFAGLEPPLLQLDQQMVLQPRVFRLRPLGGVQVQRFATSSRHGSSRGSLGGLGPRLVRV